MIADMIGPGGQSAVMAEAADWVAGWETTGAGAATGAAADFRRSARICSLAAIIAIWVLLARVP